MTLPRFVARCSGILQKPVQGRMVVPRDMSLGGSVIPVENLAEFLQVAFDSGGKPILLPVASVRARPSLANSLPGFRHRSTRTRGRGVQGLGG
jgi:ATP-dependent Lon protease